jgi:hypothetical protein
VLCLEDVFELLVLCAISTRCCWIRLLGSTNDQPYMTSHYIDLTTQTESSISVSTSDTKIQHDRKTTSQPNASKSDKQTLNIIPSNKVQPSSLIQQQRCDFFPNSKYDFITTLYYYP